MSLLNGLPPSDMNGVIMPTHAKLLNGHPASDLNGVIMTPHTQLQRLYTGPLLNGLPPSDMNGVRMPPRLLNGHPASDLNGVHIGPHKVQLLQLVTCDASQYGTVVNNINNTKNITVKYDPGTGLCVNTISNSGNISWMI